MFLTLSLSLSLSFFLSLQIINQIYYGNSFRHCPVSPTTILTILLMIISPPIYLSIMFLTLSLSLSLSFFSLPLHLLYHSTHCITKIAVGEKTKQNMGRKLNDEKTKMKRIRKEDSSRSTEAETNQKSLHL